MTPAKKTRWSGKDRREKPPVNWTPTVIGLLLVGAGIGIRLILRESFDLVPIALIVIGGAMMDKEAIRAASRMFSIRRGDSGDTEERPPWSRGE